MSTWGGTKAGQVQTSLGVAHRHYGREKHKFIIFLYLLIIRLDYVVYREWSSTGVCWHKIDKAPFPLVLDAYSMGPILRNT